MPGWLPYLICWGVFATDPVAVLGGLAGASRASWVHKGAAAEAVSDPLGESILVQSALEQPVLLDGASWSCTRAS